MVGLLLQASTSTSIMITNIIAVAGGTVSITISKGKQ